MHEGVYLTGRSVGRIHEDEVPATFLKSQTRPTLTIHINELPAMLLRQLECGNVQNDHTSMMRVCPCINWLDRLETNRSTLCRRYLFCF